MLKVVQETQESNENEAGVGGGSSSVSLLDELVRDAARQMLAVALAAEVSASSARRLSGWRVRRRRSLGVSTRARVDVA